MSRDGQMPEGDDLHDVLYTFIGTYGIIKILRTLEQIASDTAYWARTQEKDADLNKFWDNLRKRVRRTAELTEAHQSRYPR